MVNLKEFLMSSKFDSTVLVIIFKTIDNLKDLIYLSGIFFLLNINLFSQSFSDVIEFKPIIKEVIVYPDRAMILRTDKLNLKSGKRILKFDAASVQLDINSLRGFSNDKDIIINGLSTHLEKRQFSHSKEFRDLEIKLQDLELKKDLELKTIERINHDLKSVDQYSKFLSFSISENSSSLESSSSEQSWMKAFHFLNQRKNHSRTEIQKSEQLISEYNKELSKTKESLVKIHSLNDKTYRTIEINVQILKDKDYEVGFYYIINGASWKVSYGAHLESDGSLRLDYFGNIKQETGEDWMNISLKLSTSSPSRSATRIPLRSQSVLGNKIESKQEYIQTETVATEMPEVESSPEAEPSETEISNSDPNIETQSGSVLFVIEEKANIPSVEKTHKVLISEIKEKSFESKFRIAGSLQSTAHLAIQIQNRKNYPFLAGNIDSFRGNNFTGKSILDYTPPGQKSLIGFGVDRSIDFERNVKTFRDNPSTLNSNIQFHTSIELEVKNKSDKIQKVSILERIPVSEVEEIEVEIIDDTTKGSIIESKGILKWDLEFNPRESKKIKLHFKVNTPSNFPGSVYGT